MVKMYCTIKYAAAMLGIAVPTVRKLIDSGELKAIRLAANGRKTHRKIHINDLRSYMQRNKYISERYLILLVGLSTPLAEELARACSFAELECVLVATPEEAWMRIGAAEATCYQPILIVGPALSGYDAVKLGKYRPDKSIVILRDDHPDAERLPNSIATPSAEAILSWLNSSLKLGDLNAK